MALKQNAILLAATWLFLKSVFNALLAFLAKATKVAPLASLVAP